MKTFLFLTGLFIITTNKAQHFPWFFSSNAFKDWVKNEQVEKVIGVYPIFENFENYQQSIADDKQLIYNPFKQLEVHYCFNSFGKLYKVQYIHKSVQVRGKEVILNPTQYENIAVDLEKLPYSLSDNEKMELKPVEGMEELNFQYSRKYQYINHKGILFSDYGKLNAPEGIEATYHYQLLEEQYFENGMWVSSEVYLGGSVDSQMLPYYIHTWYDKTAGNVLKTQRYFPEYEDDYKMSVRDTTIIEDFCLSSMGIGPCYIDSTGKTVMEKFYLKHSTMKSKRRTTYSCQLNRRGATISLFESYFAQSIPTWSYHDYGGQLLYENFYHSQIPKGEYLLEKKFDKEGLLKSEHFYQFFQEEKQLVWKEEKFKDGYLRTQKSKYRGTLYTTFTFNPDGTFEVLEKTIDKKEVVHSKTRLKFTEFGIETYERNNQIGRFKVVYRVL